MCTESCDVDVDNYKLRVLHAGSYQSNRSLARYLHHKKMARLFAEGARTSEAPDIIIAGLPIHYCAYEAVRFGNEKGIPVIVDLRDYWPDIFLSMFPKGLQWLGRVLLRRDFRITRTALRNATSIVSMMSRMLEWGLKDYAGRSRDSNDQVFFIGGDPPGIGRVEKVGELFPGLVEKSRGRFVVNYIGGFGHFTHPTVIIHAAKYLQSIGCHEVLFLLAGNGDFHARCVKAAEGLDNVIFLGWLDTDGIEALNSISSAGVIPSVEEYSFPNKAFSYLGGGLPIFSSEHGELKSLLEKYQAGFYFDISDPVQLAKKILEVSRLDAESYRRVSDNAKSLFRDHLRADDIYRRYADYVENVARQYGDQARNVVTQVA